MLQLFLFCGFYFGLKKSLQKNEKEVKVKISHVQKHFYDLRENNKANETSSKNKDE